MWRMVPEKQQYCAINYRNGTERMLLTVETEQQPTSKRAVWVLPIPSAPQDVHIDINNTFPGFGGVDVAKESLNVVEFGTSMAALTQGRVLYSMILLGLAFKGGSIAGSAAKAKVELHERVQRMGFTAEVVSSENVDAFSEYARQEHLVLPGALRNALKDYIGKDYFVIVCWISDPEEFEKAKQGLVGEKGRAISIFLTFPSEKIFYPLRATSAYGDARIPAAVFILGFVRPNLYTGIRRFVSVNYFTSRPHSHPPKLDAFYDGFRTRPDHYGYTKVRIDAPANRFTQDLWLTVRPSLGARLFGRMYNDYFRNDSLFGMAAEVWLLVLYVVASVLSSAISAWIVYPRNRILLFSLFGFFNCFTLLGFWVGTATVGKRLLNERRWFRTMDLTLWKRSIGMWVPAAAFIIMVLSVLPLFGTDAQLATDGVIGVLAMLVSYAWFVPVLVRGYRDRRSIQVSASCFSMIFAMFTIFPSTLLRMLSL